MNTKLAMKVHRGLNQRWENVYFCKFSQKANVQALELPKCPGTSRSVLVTTGVQVGVGIRTAGVLGCC